MNEVQTRVIGVNENEIELDAITIINDDHPEAVETFFLSLSKGDGTETLNIFPATSPVTLTITDNDG